MLPMRMYASQTESQTGGSADDSLRIAGAIRHGPMTAEAINAATMALKKALIERALGGEMSHHLGYPPGTGKPATVTNQRNGTGAKTVLTEMVRFVSRCLVIATAALNRC